MVKIFLNFLGKTIDKIKWKNSINYPRLKKSKIKKNQRAGEENILQDEP